MAFGVTLAACPLVLAGLHRYRVIDDANWRSSHSGSVPRGGGIALAIGIAVALAVTPDLSFSLRAGLLVLGLGVGLVGLADDLTGGVPPEVRLGATLLFAAGSLVWLAPAAGLTGPTRLVVVALCLGWIGCYVNAFNFMDGINGISVGQVLVIGSAIAIAASIHNHRSIAIAALVVAGSALAFAPFNFPRARMFLGDVGSYLLGALIAGLVIAAVTAGIPVEAAAAGAVLYAADTFVTLLRRLRRGDAWHQAHREHVYQLLTDRGFSHAAVTTFVTSLTTICAGLGIIGAELGGLWHVLATGAILLVVVGYLASPKVLALRKGYPISERYS